MAAVGGNNEVDVMRRQFCTAVFLLVWLQGSCFGGPQTQIWYSADDLGGGQWQCNYDVANSGLTPPIEQFTIYFDYGAYENLAVETPGTPADWNQIVWQPEPVLQDAGGYDAKALAAGINVGQTLGGFAVSFDWLGQGEPGPQLYEIVNPATLETIDSGMTRLIPEPATLLLVGLGAIILKKINRGAHRGHRENK